MELQNTAFINDACFRMRAHLEMASAFTGEQDGQAETCAQLLADYNATVRKLTGVDPHWYDGTETPEELGEA